MWHDVGRGIDENFRRERSVGVRGDVHELEHGGSRRALVLGDDVPDTDAVADVPADVVGLRSRSRRSAQGVR